MSLIDHGPTGDQYARSAHWPERVTRRHIDLQRVSSAICRHS